DLNNLAQLLQALSRLAEAEPLMRRALAIDEASYGPEHPDVAIDLNNLAQLLQDLSHLAEAEPLMRRSVEIFLASSAGNGYVHPHLDVAASGYLRLLEAAGDTPQEAAARLRELYARHGVNADPAAGHA
ncbi:MAG: tetratricopeptide repeat protein, partial [Rhodocyclaceae bacterium]|nr:tetratricopeptide repeat protein [Rhodocyclaceae bacterium]